MMAIIIVGSFFGEYLDSKNNFKTPVFTISCSLGSIFLAMYYVLENIKKRHEKK